MTAESPVQPAGDSLQRLTDWTPQATRDWGTAPIQLCHHLTETGLFTDESLADIVDSYPVESYSLVSMGSSGSDRRWRTGRLRGVSGADLIDVLRADQLWLNLRAIDKVDPRFAQLFGQFIGELNCDVPGLDATGAKMGLLISGPGTQVDYHADLPGQSLWQIRGEKTVYVYPSSAPYITEQQLQDIGYDGIEKISYTPDYDAAATVLPITSGDMLHWPLNGPHRVDNGPMLNVSVTTEYVTPHIKRLNQMNLANAILRRKMHVSAAGRPTSGLRYRAKAALQAGYARTGLLEKERTRVQSPSFSVVKEADGSIKINDI